MSEWPEALVEKVARAICGAHNNVAIEYGDGRYWVTRATAALDALELREEESEVQREFGWWTKKHRFVTPWEDV